MSDRYVIEARLRPAVELNTAVVSAVAAGGGQSSVAWH